MRNAFIKALEDEAEKNKDVFLLVGDLGYSVIENFQKKFPRQFLNVGVAEQDMTGIAAGLASTGKIVFTYSIGNFPTLRCLEQIRNDVCYHKLNVKIVAVGGGFHYGALASTHHATEDLAIMRSLPNMVVLAPGDRVESELATRAAIAWKGPCYLRLSNETRLAHQSPLRFTIGKAITLREGEDLTIIATGSMLVTALDTADLLKENGISAAVISMHTLKPLDRKVIVWAAKKTKHIVTIEEHTIIGGLGGAVAETLFAEDLHPKLDMVGINDSFPKVVGGRDYLRKKFGLIPQAIAKRILLGRRKK
jgi:transketolase